MSHERLDVHQARHGNSLISKENISGIPVFQMGRLPGALVACKYGLRSLGFVKLGEQDFLAPPLKLRLSFNTKA